MNSRLGVTKYYSVLYVVKTCPQVELKMFLERKARARNFNYFRWQSERESGSFALEPVTGTGNVKRKTLRKSMYLVVQPSLDLDRFIVYSLERN